MSEEKLVCTVGGIPQLGLRCVLDGMNEIGAEYVIVSNVVWRVIPTLTFFEDGRAPRCDLMPICRMQRIFQSGLESRFIGLN